ncbi:MAG: gluconokinase [Pseudomonadota bacterium]
MVRLICVMGVAGCGKSTIGADLAAALYVPFLEADQFHPATNIAKMTAGTPLTDEDRWPWLDALGAGVPAAGRAVIACSALRRVYRERLAAAAGDDVFFIHLAGTRDVILGRMATRTGHFMPPALIDSQFATLERPSHDEPHIALDISAPPDILLTQALDAVKETT